MTEQIGKTKRLKIEREQRKKERLNKKNKQQKEEEEKKLQKKYRRSILLLEISELQKNIKKVDYKWFEKKLEETGLLKNEVAKFTNINPSAFSVASKVGYFSNTATSLLYLFFYYYEQRKRNE